MKEQLIIFETAKLAKEKGFDIKIEQRFLGIEGYTRKVHKDLEILVPEYCQPTQSLLQKWIREVHNIHLVIQYSKHWKGYQWRYDDWRNREDNPNTKRNSYDEYKTYEEALEIGLYQGLLLIKSL